MFKDYDVYRVQSLEEKLEDLDSLSLNYWLTKFVQEVAKTAWKLKFDSILF